MVQTLVKGPPGSALSTKCDSRSPEFPSTDARDWTSTLYMQNMCCNWAMASPHLTFVPDLFSCKWAATVKTANWCIWETVHLMVSLFKKILWALCNWPLPLTTGTIGVLTLMCRHLSIWQVPYFTVTVPKWLWQRGEVAAYTEHFVVGNTYFAALSMVI